MRDLPTRKKLRLKDYDYSACGAYFVTICTQNRENHFHCIIFIHRAGMEYQRNRADTRSAPTNISDVVQAFKSKTTVEYVRNVKRGLYPAFNKRVWQRNYHDHIIRSETEYEKIWRYIDENPASWKDDVYFTDAKPFEEAIEP